MNILHIMKDYKPGIGGSVVRNGNMIDHYCDCFDDHITIIDLDGNRFMPESIEDGVRVVRCKSLLSMIIAAISHLKKESVDILQVHNFRFLFAGYVAKLIASRKTKISVELHALYRMSKYKEMLSYWLLGKTDLITVLSESAKQYLIQEKKICSDKVLVLRNGVFEESEIKEDTKIRNDLSLLGEDYCVVAYTGSFIDWQGVRFLADSYEYLAETFPKLFLLMLGDGPDFDYVKTTVYNSKYKDRVVVEHSVNKNALRGIFDEIDIVIIPRIKNLCTNTAVPLKAIEAMQMGKCIVASDDNGLTELLNDNNARIFEAYNIDSLINQLSDVIVNPELRDFLGKQAQKEAKKALHTWESNAFNLHERYIKMCENK